MPRWPKSKRPDVVIRKHGPSKEFSGPSTFRDTGSFSTDQFKAGDRDSGR